MGRFRQRSSEDNSETGIDISPLMDCVFILLIFFIVTTTFVEETGIEVDKPQAASAAVLDKNSILLAITAQGQVFYGGQEVGVGGVRPLVRRLSESEPLPVIIQVDKMAAAGIVVRVLDEAKLGGAKNVSVATEQGA